jgi:hypothetical protein
MTRADAMTRPDAIATIAEAEAILNRTLAYQAAIAVHELKARLNVEVTELRLTVAPPVLERPGSYRVTCTIAGLAADSALVVDAVGRPEQAK